MVEEPLKIGNPWSILPIKNAKYARDLIEVHLSDRDLDLLEKFEDFPNLEVLWLNNNKVWIEKIFYFYLPHNFNSMFHAFQTLWFLFYGFINFDEYIISDDNCFTLLL